MTAPATDAAKLWDGYGTALKPAYEPIVLGMRPLDGTFAGNAVVHGVAGLNIDGSRIVTNNSLGGGSCIGSESSSDGWDRPWKHDPEKLKETAERAIASVAKAEALGRWPANVILDEEAAANLDAQSGSLASGAYPERRYPDKFRNTYQAYAGSECIPARGADAGGASRFFYTAKADAGERGTGNNHPTVKPLDLMRYLCKLLAPPGRGSLVDPFMGSGSTLLAGRRFFDRVVGIELNENYCEIAARRLSQEVLEFA